MNNEKPETEPVETNKKDISYIHHDLLHSMLKIKAVASLFYAETYDEERRLDQESSNGLHRLLDDIALDIETSMEKLECHFN